MPAKNKTSSPSQGIRIRQKQDETPRCALSEDGFITYANTSFYELIGLKPGSKDSARNAFDLLTFADDDIDDAEKLKNLSTGTHRILLKEDRSIIAFHFDWLTSPNNTRYLIASQIDKSKSAISEKEIDTLLSQIQAATENSNEGLQRSLIATDPDLIHFINMSRDHMIVLDKTGKISKANQIFSDAMGYKLEELQKLSLVDLFHPDDTHLIRTAHVQIKRAYEKGAETTSEYEGRLITKSGTELWIEWRQTYLNNRIFASGRDITAYRKKQEDLLNQKKQLSEAEAIGRMGHWHWMVGEENISWSEELFRIFGVDSNHFLPTMRRITEMVHRRDTGRVIQIFQRAIIEHKNYDMEFRIIRPGGDVRYIQCEGRCEKDPNGDVIALYGIVQDITERVLYEKKLREAKDASEQAYAAKSRFLANMSHELRTPLNAIIGFSEIMQNQLLGPIDNPKYIEYASGIRDSGQHLLDLISDILDMSKIEAGKYSLDLSEVRVAEVLKTAAKMMEERAKEACVTLKIEDVCRENLILIADRRAIKQVFLNLLTNAIKFTEENGSVWVECQEREEYLSIKICDTGIGIPANKLASVLRPFEQVSTHYTRDYEGTGLGLSITKELVELHGGILVIESTVGIGTTVSVRLPYDASKKISASK